MHYIKFVSFFLLFLHQLPPLCKYFNFFANKFSSTGMNLFLILSRHIKHLNFMGISMLRMKRGAKHELLYRVLRFLWARWYIYFDDKTKIKQNHNDDDNKTTTTMKTKQGFYHHLVIVVIFSPSSLLVDTGLFFCIDYESIFCLYLCHLKMQKSFSK